MNDLARAQRFSVAAAYRRLADEASKAAAEMSDPHGASPHSVQSAVLGRVESVRHAHRLLSATTVGEARAAHPASGGPAHA